MRRTEVHRRLPRLGRPLVGAALVLSCAALFPSASRGQEDAVQGSANGAGGARGGREVAPTDPLDDHEWLEAHYASVQAMRTCLDSAQIDSSDEDSGTACSREARLALLLALPASPDALMLFSELAELASGSDPDVAPRAARAAVLVLDQLDRQMLTSREIQVDPSWQQAWEAVLDRGVRRDIHAAAQDIIARLAELAGTQLQQGQQTTAD